MKQRLVFLFVFTFLISAPLFSQRDIVKNGVRINRVDKNKKKQDRWFFFNNDGDIVLSCDYKNDSLSSPLTFYTGRDTAFIRFPKTNDTEIFILYINDEKLIGNYRKLADTAQIEILGKYLKISTDSIEIIEDSTRQYGAAVTERILKWFAIKIPPLYMFGNALVSDFLYGGFHGSDFVFNKSVYAEITINESGLVEKIEFPPAKNNLSINEETEIGHIFSGMPRWQPYFADGETHKITIPYMWGTTLEKIGSSF